MKAKIRCICGFLHTLEIGASVSCKCGGTVTLDQVGEQYVKPSVTYPDEIFDAVVTERNFNKPKFMGWAK